MSDKELFKKCPVCKQYVQSHFKGEASEKTKFNWGVECLMCGHEGLGTDFYFEPDDEQLKDIRLGDSDCDHSGDVHCDNCRPKTDEERKQAFKNTLDKITDDQARSMVGTEPIEGVDFTPEELDGCDHDYISDDGHTTNVCRKCAHNRYLALSELKEGDPVQLKEDVDVPGFDITMIYIGEIKKYGPELCEVEFNDETKAGVYMIPTDALELLRPSSLELFPESGSDSRIEKIREFLGAHDSTMLMPGITDGQIIWHAAQTIQTIRNLAYEDEP